MSKFASVRWRRSDRRRSIVAADTRRRRREDRYQRKPGIWRPLLEEHPLPGLELMGRHLALARDRVERLTAQEPQDELRFPLDAPAFRELHTSAGGGSLPGVVVGFRALSFMPGLLGCRHRSPDGVQGNRVRFIPFVPQDTDERVDV